MSLSSSVFSSQSRNRCYYGVLITISHIRRVTGLPHATTAAALAADASRNAAAAGCLFVCSGWKSLDSKTAEELCSAALKPSLACSAY